MCKATDKIKEIGRAIIGHDQEVPSPQDWIKEIDDNLLRQAIKYNGKPLEERYYWRTQVTDTNSMDGPLDIGHDVVCYSHPDCIDKVTLGDVIIFEKWTPERKWIMHQIIWIEDNGEFSTQGWNCSEPDWWTVNKSEIQYVVLGIVW